jgi:purine nucleosidase
MDGEKIKVLLDTDIGSDIDDAVCLAYLLSHPRCDLLGVTTVTGEADRRAMMVSAMCRQAGRSIPIYPGAEVPLLLPQKQTHAPQARSIGSWDHQTRFPEGEAIEFLRRTIRQNPGEVVLIAIAPLTNLGLLFSVDPGIPRLLRGLVMMCGRFIDPFPQGYGPLEWNAYIDAHASAIVYRAPVQQHRSVGLDVTSKVVLREHQFRTAFRDLPVFAPVMDWADVWFGQFPITTFHDPLAAATVFEPSLCTYQQGCVSLELDDPDQFGLTRWVSEEANGVHEVAVTVDADGFFRHFMDVVSGRR